MNSRDVDVVPDSAELQLARHLLARMAQRGALEASLIQTWVQPSQYISGDVIAAARTPTDELNVLVADPTGHGLAAVISALPIIDVFYSMCEKGFPITSIARELNRKAHFLLPADRFLAATLISINYAEKVVRVWSGGAPALYFITAQGDIARTWESNHPAFGVLADDDFDGTVQAYRWQHAGDIMLFSDGLPHAKNTAGEALGTDRIMRLAQIAGERVRFASLVAHVEDHIGLVPQDDDLSIVSIHCNPAIPWRKKPHHPSTVATDTVEMETCWRLHLALGAAQIRQVDTLPWVMNWLDQLQIAPQHRGQAFMVIGELFNNALDHGLLGLESELKQGPGGFEAYLDAREARLEALDGATIELDLECFKTQDKNCLRVTIRDSGPGFDHTAAMNHQESDEGQFSGRGLMLVRRLCQSLEYSPRGNEVTAIYVLDGAVSSPP